METAELLDLLGTIPIWAWVGIVFFVLVTTGDRGLWDYEAKFPLQPGIGRGEVELKRYKKKGGAIEIKLELEPPYRDKRIGIRLNDQLLYTIPEDKNARGRLYLNEQVDLQEPREGDLVSVEIDGTTVFNGPLVLD
jgi:hypothetical protein